MFSIRMPGLLPFLLASLSVTATAADIWIEGESAAESTVQRHPWWYDKVKTDQLSGGDFITNWSDKADGAVAYTIKVDEAGSYRLWLRANPTAAKLGWKLDDAQEKDIDFGPAIDNVNIAADAAPDLRFLAWIDLGKLELAAGEHHLRFRMHSENNHHGMIDCLVLTTGAFVPKGTRKPGEAAAKPQSLDGRWAFDPEQDTFSADSLLDLRSLNETVAGEHGFITRTKDGSDFARGDGVPMRFWAMHSDVWHSGFPALQDHARFLAKRGVNLVRCHGSLPNMDGGIDEVNQHQVQELWDCVAAMKKEGIYVIASPYYPHATGLDDARRKRWGIDSKQGNMTGLVYFDPKVQAAYKQWLRAMLEPVNPRTGLALKDEPALALIQLQNEDSLLFWTVQDIQGGELKILQETFGRWATKAHGSVQAAFDLWKEPVEGDDAAAGRVALRHIWDLTSDGVAKKGRSPRLADQARFMAGLMHDWNAEVGRFLREEIHAKQLVNAGNWRTADAVSLSDLERWSYTANEVQAMNRYTGSLHVGDNAGWAITTGDKYTSYSALLDPTSLPVSIKQPVGMPFIIPESNWVPPTLNQSEGPFLVAAYMSLNGLDGYFWFSTGQTQWRQPGSANGYLPSIGKWDAATPEILGNFPAAALMYRKGYLKQGAPVVSEQRALDDLWALRTPVISEEGAFDPNRDAGSFAATSTVHQEVSRLAYLAGPVVVTYGGDSAKTVIDPKLAELVDEKAKIVRANTGEITMDYGHGVCVIDGPKAQGVTGFLAKERPKTVLSSLTIESGNDYATVLAVSMDDQPLTSSKRVLVQIGTTCRPTGWAEKPVTWTQDGKQLEGFQIEAFGEKPWQVVNNDCSITLKNPGITEAVVLDMNGLKRGTVPVEKVDGGVRFTLPKDAKYVIAR